MQTRSKKSSSYFRVPPFYYFPAIFSGIGLCTVLAIAPDLIPYESLWYVGKFLHTMAYDYHPLSLLICCAAWGAHVFEAVFAYILCRRLNLTDSDTLKWTAQTFILGFPSLHLLKERANKSQQ